MKKQERLPVKFHSISELHRVLGLPKPLHPLVSLVDYAHITTPEQELPKMLLLDFYKISYKKNLHGKIRYGQQYYDFDEGTMTFFSPTQVISTVVESDYSVSGTWLVVHPDFIRNYQLSKKIREYGFFSYAVNEALHLSEEEETMIKATMLNIDQEYRSAIDNYSQDVMVSHIDLLLNYCNRFYNRQFITRKNANNALLTKVEEVLSDYFESGKVTQNGLPTVHYLSEQLNVSSNYLSDMLRTITGQNTQQHIHLKLIEKAKEILTSTTLSVSEIAYELGFEYPQSFSKLFKNKTNFSPLEFRNSFN